MCQALIYGEESQHFHISSTKQKCDYAYKHLCSTLDDLEEFLYQSEQEILSSAFFPQKNAQIVLQK